jgi:hypothetical protein
MKSLNFQRNKSLIRVVNERKVTIKRNWDRIVYLGLLVAFILFMCYYFISKLLFVHGYGHIIIDKTTVRLTDDARIISFYKAEGDSISINDTLFSYALDRDDEFNSNNLSIDASSQDKDDWWKKEEYALKKKIALNSIDISVNSELIKTYSKEIKRVTNEVILDILPKTRLDVVQNEINKLEAENKKLNIENVQLNNLIKSTGPRLNGKSYNLNLQRAGQNPFSGLQSLAFSEEFLSEPKYFKSPVNGISTQIFSHNFETVLKDEKIMEIHHNQTAFVKAYFALEDVKQFKINDEVTISFPDGTNSKGILKRLYNATYTLPEEFQKKYESTTRVIAADVYPIDSTEIKKWEMFYKISVDISKSKF